MENVRVFKILKDNRKIKYLVLSVTKRCNLNCKYCYRGTAGSAVMSRDVADSAIELLDPMEGAHVQITGGEPLLHCDLVEYIAWKIRKTMRKVTIGIQTNGTLMNEEFTGIVKKYDLQVGVSLDGRKEVNESIRGQSSSVFAGLALLQKNNVEFRTTTVVSNLNVNHIHEIPFILSAFENSRGMALDMLVAKGMSMENDVTFPEREELERALNRLIDNIKFINRMRKVPLQLREINKVCEYNNSKSYCHAEKGESLAVSPTGELYPCGQVIDDRLFYMGHIKDFNSASLPIDKSGILFDYKNINSCHSSRWDCPSRKFYNRSEEDWPDLYGILNNIMAGSDENNEKKRSFV